MFLRFGNGISRYFIKGNEVGIREHCLDIGTSHVPPFLDRQYRLPANKLTVILISINRYNNRSKSIQGKKDNYITKNDVSCNEKRFWLRQAGFAGNSKGLSRDAQPSGHRNISKVNVFRRSSSQVFFCWFCQGNTLVLLARLTPTGATK